MDRLLFSKGNSYLPKDVHTFSLPSGWTCPGADQCLSKCDRTTGKISDGPNTVYRCYSATCERYPSVRERLWHNLTMLRGLSFGEMVALIRESLPEDMLHCRLHVHGDFFSQDYFDAWLTVAGHYPGIRFWAFTKSLPFWVSRLDRVPENLVLQASKGGKHDALIAEHGLKFAEVCYSVEEAEAKGLKIDFDDALARVPGPPFGLLIHGQQPKGSKAAQASRILASTRREHAQAG